MHGSAVLPFGGLWRGGESREFWVTVSVERSPILFFAVQEMEPDEDRSPNAWVGQGAGTGWGRSGRRLAKYSPILFSAYV